jgi:hypothetical protein
MEQTPCKADYHAADKKFPAFMELENPPPCSQQQATEPYPVPDESNPHPHT